MGQLPNIISIFRTTLAIALAIFILKYYENKDILLYAFWITWIVILLDGIDGIIARKFKITSDFGAFFDIACDRIVELIYISLFVTLGWIPFWILVVFFVRGILVDGIRGFAQKEGKTAFGEKSMMKNKIGFFLTSSRFMRFTYGGVKALAFALMFLVYSYCPGLLSFGLFLIYFTVFLCIIRGIPVLIEGKRYF